VQKRDPGGAFMLGFDAETGSQHLETQYSVFYQDIRAPAYHDGHLYGFAHQDGGVGSFSATASKLKWTFRVDRHEGWSPVVDQNRVIVYSQDGLNVLNRTTGGLRYTIPDPQYGFRVADRVQSPVYDGRDSVFVTQFNRLLRFDLESRSIAWTMEFGDNTLGQAALANGTVYVVDGGELVAIDAARGEHLWRWAPRRNILSDLVVTVDHIFVATSRRTIAFNLNTRKIDWSHPVPGRLSLGNDGILYIATDKAEIVAIRVFPDPAGPQ
jgi:outer membrane protein assembly factor BamB